MVVLVPTLYVYSVYTFCYYFPQSASSQRMMDLMGGGVGSVIGFSSVSGVTSSRHRGLGAESHGAVDETLYGESSQFQGVMKQLGKRDPTTKLKVLLVITLGNTRLELCCT